MGGSVMKAVGGVTNALGITKKPKKAKAPKGDGGAADLKAHEERMAELKRERLAGVARTMSARAKARKQGMTSTIGRDMTEKRSKRTLG